MVKQFKIKHGLIVDGEAVITGSLIVLGGISGSLSGSNNIDTGSLVTTSSFNNFTSSYNTGSFTGSFSGLLEGTASFAVTSSFALNANFDTSSLVTTSSFNNFTSSYNTGSFKGDLYGTSSWANNAITASHLVGTVNNSISSSYSDFALTASYALSYNMFGNIDGGNSTTININMNIDGGNSI